MAFSVGALYFVRKATPEPDNGKANPAPDGNLTAVVKAFSLETPKSSGLEVGTKVRIRSGRFQGKYEGREGTIATEPSGFGMEVEIGEEKTVFFLKDEISPLN